MNYISVTMQLLAPQWLGGNHSIIGDILLSSCLSSDIYSYSASYNTDSGISGNVLKLINYEATLI